MVLKGLVPAVCGFLAPVCSRFPAVCGFCANKDRLFAGKNRRLTLDKRPGGGDG